MKRIKGIVCLCLVSVLLFACACADAPGTAQNDSRFNSALREFEVYISSLQEDTNRLNSIAKQFEELKSYSVSRELMYYTRVLIKIAEGKFDSQYRIYLRLLADSGSLDKFLSGLWYTPLGSTQELIAYANGREAEFKNDLSAAAEYYSRCTGFYDAINRYYSISTSQTQQAYERAMNYLAENDVAAAYIEFTKCGSYDMLKKIRDWIGYTPENERDNPGRVQSVTARYITTSSVTLFWSAAAHATSYKIEYRLTGSYSWSRGSTTTATAFTVNGLYANRLYDFRVTAYAKDFETQPFVLTNVLTGSYTPVPTPTPTPVPTSVPTPTYAPYYPPYGTPVKVGDTVLFGSYEQDNNRYNGAEPIQWTVLDVESDGTCLLFSKYALDSKPYNTTDREVTWETCSLRTWLNETFYSNAFNQSERQSIVITYNRTLSNPLFGVNGGNDTYDYVFLLSVDDMQQYIGLSADTGDRNAWFISGEMLIYPTEYAVAQSTWVNNVNGSCWCMLRTPGRSASYMSNIGANGYVYLNGNKVNSGRGGVVPAIRVKLF